MPPLPRPTARPVLRRWRAEDRAPFARLNADPEVMEHFPATMTPAQSDALIESIEASIDRDGSGFWAVALRDADELIGFTGLGGAAPRGSLNGRWRGPGSAAGPCRSRPAGEVIRTADGCAGTRGNRRQRRRSWNA